MAEQAAAPNRLAVAENEVDEAAPATQPAVPSDSDAAATVQPESGAGGATAFTIVDTAVQASSAETVEASQASPRTQDQSMIDLAIEKALDGVRAELEASSAEAIEVAAAEAPEPSANAADGPVGSPEPEPEAEAEATQDTEAVEQGQTETVVDDDALGIDDEAQRLIEAGIAPPRQASRPSAPDQMSEPDQPSMPDQMSEPDRPTEPDALPDPATQAVTEAAPAPDVGAQEPGPADPIAAEPTDAPPETLSVAETTGPEETDAPAMPVETPVETLAQAAAAPDLPDEAEPAQPLTQLLARMTPQTSLEDLGQAVTAAGGRPMDQMVEDVLRPLVREWVSENLPLLAERLVREEIEKVSRTRG